MGKRRYAVGMILCLWLFASAQEHPGHGPESRLLAVENVWNQAEVRGDVKALSLIFDNLLIYVDEDGRLLTKGEFLARAQAESAHPQSLTTQSMNAQIYGNTAVVTGTYRTEGVKRGKRYQREGRFTDIWIQRDGTWVCVAAQATPILQ
jgi:ketosteroid isomerase-like protein